VSHPGNASGSNDAASGMQRDTAVAEASAEMTLDVPRMVPILTATEAAATAARVFELRREWRRVQPERDAYVLGTASYLALRFAEYRALAATSNALLRSSFGELYERLFARLAPVLAAVHDGPLVVESAYGLPGFQILLVDEQHRDPRGLLGGAHWDWNFLHLEWQPSLPEELDLSQVASFTLAVQLPAAGGGLLVWGELTSAEVNELALERHLKQWEAVPALIEDKTPAYHPYRTGDLVIHSGHLVHQVAPWKWSAGDARITLQGHGLFHDGAWHIYW
jgi:hypothetical protein